MGASVQMLRRSRVECRRYPLWVRRILRFWVGGGEPDGMPRTVWAIAKEAFTEKMRNYMPEMRFW